MKRVIGIGNALTDMLVNLKTDSVLGRFKLAKGSMSLVDTRLQTEISKSVAGLPYSLSLGGSAGNTIRAMAQLGCSVGFIGKVGPDTTGDFFVQALVNLKTDSVLGRFKLAKGSMSLVDTRLQTEISKSVAGLPYSLSLGGSAGNTIRAMAQLGCSVGFIGKVGPDTTGDFFVQALDNLGIEPIIFRGRERSGKCVSLISADGERTMVTHLGAALELSAGEIEPSIFEGYDCLYVEGYLVQNHDLILKAARTAKKCGLKVAIDLASFNIVAENLEFLRGLVSEHVDIVFANEDEAKTFTCEAEPLNALQAISQMCELAVVKIGTKGALIKQGEEVVHVGIMAAAKRVDTTGAGDFYAAGFLAGLCDGLSLRQCGTIGAITAGKVIEVVGTTFGEEAWADIHRLVNKVKNEKYLF